MGLLKLADKYSVERLEAACKKALNFTASPSYKSVKNILVSGSDKENTSEVPLSKEPNKYALTRGAKYYGGKE